MVFVKLLSQSLWSEMQIAQLVADGTSVPAAGPSLRQCH